MKYRVLIFLLSMSTTLISQVCIEFETTPFSANLTTTDLTYEAFYEESGVVFKHRFEPDLAISPYANNTTINSHELAGYTGSNGASNFKDNILYLGNSAVQVDFQNLQYDAIEIEFDVNEKPTSFSWYKVNNLDLDNLPSNITFDFIPLTHGMHVVATGPIETIQFSAFELAIDNLCVRNMVSATSQTHALANDIRLFPNPSNSQITIDGPASSEPTRILNMMGVEVQRINNSEREIQHNLNSGSYYLELSDNDRVFHKRFVVIK